MKSSTSRPSRIVLVLSSVLLLAGGALVWKMTSRRHPQPKSAPHVASSDRAGGSAPDRGPAPPVSPTVLARSSAVLANTMKTAPERLSTTAQLPRFDKAAFDANPDSYLTGLEPARCYQTLRPGPNVQVLEAKSDLRAGVASGQELQLLVRTAGSAPVTFTSFGGGAFRESAVSTVTVRADARGLAIVHFIANPGLAGDVPIVAGSPLAAGNVKFLLRVVGA